MKIVVTSFKRYHAGIAALSNLDPDLPVSVLESLAEAWVCGDIGQRWPGAGLGALSAAVHTWGLLKDVTIVFITSTIVWP